SREYRGQWYSRNGIAFHDFDSGTTLLKWRDEKDATPMVTSHALAKDHLLATTLRGELIVLALEGKSGAPPFRYRTPQGKGIGSSPVVSGGHVYFGCDDGCFYVLGPEGNVRAKADDTL